MHLLLAEQFLPWQHIPQYHQALAVWEVQWMRSTYIHKAQRSLVANNSRALNVFRDFPVGEQPSWDRFTSAAIKQGRRLSIYLM